MKMLWWFLSVIFFAAAAIAAEDYPTLGLVYNTTENSSLTYQCHLERDNRLECDFIQSSVRIKMNDINAEKHVAMWGAYYLSNPDQVKKDANELCKMGTNLDDVFQIENA
jgi:hypothetical protein